MKKKRFIIISSVIVIMLFLSLCSLILSIINDYDYKNKTRIFNSIDDLNFIDKYVIEEDIKSYDKIISRYEKHLLDCKNVRIKYNGKKIDIHSYVFKSPEYCLDYAGEVSGNNYYELYMRNGRKLSMYYHKQIIFFSEKLLVFSGEKVYVIHSKSSQKNFNKFIEYFMEQLPLEVQMSF